MSTETTSANTPDSDGDADRGPLASVAGFTLRTDLAYDQATRTWIESRPDGLVRIGLDPVEVEASGTVAALSLVEVGAEVARGDQIGSLEAEKYVGPLKSPLAGVVESVNEQVISHPSQVDADPYEAWLVEIRPSGPLPQDLVSGEQKVIELFEHQVREYRLKGVLAE